MHSNNSAYGDADKNAMTLKAARHSSNAFKAALAGSASLAIVAFAAPALAQEATPVPAISVIAPPSAAASPSGSSTAAASSSSTMMGTLYQPGEPLIAPPADNAPNPSSTIGPEGIQTLAAPAFASAYKPLDLLPSVLEESADPYGLSTNRSITVRGVSDFFLSKNINGLPIQGIVGGFDLLDLENVSKETLYRGALQANQGLGFSNAGGALDLTILAPKQKAGGYISQGVGQDGFWRDFARVDSGKLDTGTSFFISGSIADADKWKGTGDARRENVSLGISQSLGDSIDLNLYGIHNYQKTYNYLGLTYAQSKNLPAFANLDYNAKGNSNYYGTNMQEYRTNALLGDATYRIDGAQSVTIKPYLWRNDGQQWSGSGPSYTLWPVDNYTYGVVAEYKAHFKWNGDLTLGFWTETAKPEPPPLGQQAFNLSASDALTFSKWSLLTKTDNHEFYSPYAQYTQVFGATTLSGGLRLHIEGVPWMQTYTSLGTLPQTTYNNVFAFNPKADPNGVFGGQTFYEWLPNFGVHHDLTKEWSLNAAFSSKIARPDWGPQASNFNSNEAAFLAHGMNLQWLMGALKPERVDMIDIGARYHSGDISVVPTLFGFKTHDKEVLVYDPAVAQSYYQSNGATTGYGAELEGSWKALEYLTFTGSLTAASETYDSNLTTHSGAITAIKGNQVPFTPKYMEKLAISYHRDRFEITPVLRYISKVYGLADDSQSANAYFVADLTASYEFGSKLWGFPVKANFGVKNLFNRQYIGLVSVNEDNLNSTSYYVAPPRTVYAGLSAQF